ncbi:MAG: hypothetical protein KBB01_06660, partial [Candidatus Omnitrophica bacterium]|nr:hypothetical protein [Candidatus Omnitrophota bacterium]
MFNKNSGTGLKILAILSGMAGVGYEVFFFRLLTNYLGDMFYVHATLLSSFLLGIGIGSKKAYRFHGYLHVVEWLIGLYALLFPTILSIAQQQQWLRITLGNPALTSLLTILFLGPPSILIGFSVPLFSAYLKNTQAQKAFASIYTVYNLGAFVSVLLIELFLIRIFGISFSLYCNGTLNIVIGIILFFRYGGIRSVKPQDTEKEILFSRRVILALAVSSFASSIFQMFFYKTCFHIFDTNRENFAIGLAVTFIAISIGTYLVRRYKLSFDTCMLLAIFSLGLIFFLFKEIHRFFMSLWDLARYSHLYRPFFKLALASAYGLPPLAFFGATIPAILRSEKAVAKESGHLLWISCLGNALGYLFYVYYGHVHLSNNGLISAIAGLCFLACLLMHGLDYLKKRALSLTILVLLTTLMAFRW